MNSRLKKIVESSKKTKLKIEKENVVRKKIMITINIILTLVLVVLLCQDVKNEKKIEEIYKEMDQELRPVSTRLFELRYQIYKTQNKIVEERTGTATTQILITDLSSNSYEWIIKPMSAYSYPVVLGLSLGEMPGKEGCITVEQAESLAAQGWSFCYAYQIKEVEKVGERGADALSAWMEQVKQEAAEAGLNMEPAVYFPFGTYKTELDSVLKAKGIQTVIHRGELGNGLLRAAKENDLWYVGGTWWRGNEILDNKLSTISSKGGELVTLMGIDGRSSTTLQDWMGQFENIVKQNMIAVTNFSDMPSRQEENERLSEEKSADDRNQLEEFVREQEELEQKKDDIESQHMKETGKYR